MDEENLGGGEEDRDEEGKGKELNIVMRAPADAKGGKVQVIVSDAEGNLLATDHGDLMGITAREKLVKRLCEALNALKTESNPEGLKLEGQRADDFAAEVNRVWLDFYKAQQDRAGAGPAQKCAAELLAETAKEVQEAAEATLKAPGLLKGIQADIRALGVAGEEALALLLFVVGVSRLLPRPLSARVHGPSASGKSYLISRVAGLFPEEAIIRAAQITPNALFYMPPGSLVHRWVVAGERSRAKDDEVARATSALREMQSEGRLSKLLTVKRGGEMVATLVNQDGPIAYVESATLAKVFDEDANRCLTLHTNETGEQTRRVMKSVAARHAGTAADVGVTGIIERHHAMQRLLQPRPVVIPYAEALADLLGGRDEVELRRGFAQVLTTVEALTLLRQYQRESDADGRLVATIQDYDIACRLLDGPMARLLGVGVSEGAVRFLEQLRKEFEGKGAFSTTQAKKVGKNARSAVYGWLHELHEAGLVKQIAEGRGSVPATWGLGEAPAEDIGDGRPGPIVLPRAEKLLGAWTQPKT